MMNEINSKKKRVNMTNRRNELAPCGVFCEACPSFNKTCLGCSSENIMQNRKSKWNCKIRRCCVDEHKFDSCSQCSEFTHCKLIIRLQQSHLGEKKFRYREEIIDNLNRIKEIGKVSWLKDQQIKYNCQECEATVIFYYYECLNCGFKMNLK